MKKVGKVVNTQLLAESITEKSSLTPGDVQSIIHNLMSMMRMYLLNSHAVYLNGLGTFITKACTRGKGTEKAEDVNPNQVTASCCQFTPEYTCSTAIGTTRALLQDVEFEKRLKAVVEDGVPGGDELDDGEEEDLLG